MSRRPDTKSKNYYWHYYKMYVGENEDALDYVITNSIADAISKHGTLGWFYLRYVDEGGLHLRVRFKAGFPNNTVEERTLYKSLHDGLASISQRPPSGYTPIIKSGMRDSSPTYKRNISCVRAHYEPEVEVFGGLDGVEIAEYLFKESSEISRNILSLELERKINRKDFLLALMNQTLDAFINKDKQKIFLKNYAAFWLSGSPHIGSMLELFSNRAYELLDKEEIKINAEAVPTQVGTEMILQWRKFLAHAHGKFATRPELFTQSRQDDIAFHIIHLFNNRLGINILEEAYLAVLLSTYKDTTQ